MSETKMCTGCYAESFVAARNTAHRCAECQMNEIGDDVVIDALSRAICAVIADAVKDERKAKEADADSFRVEFNSEGVECTSLNRAHGWTGTNCVCVDCVAHRIEAKRQTEERSKLGPVGRAPSFISKNKPAMTAEQAMQVAAMRRNAEDLATKQMLQQRIARGEVDVNDLMPPGPMPQFAPGEVAAIMADKPPSTHADDRCARCNSDMSYADPGQSLCYGCRST